MIAAFLKNTAAQVMVAALLAIALLAGCGEGRAPAGSDEQTQTATAPLETWRTFRHAPPTADWYDSFLAGYSAYQTWDGSNWCMRISTTGTFEHTPALPGHSDCDWSMSHLDTYAAYKTWDGSNWCMRVTNGVFEHAPNCDWSQHHFDIVMNYKNFAGENWALTFE